MHIFILAGSHRDQAQSSKVAHFVQAQLDRIYPDASNYILNLATQSLPLWDDGMWNNESDFYQEVAPIRTPIAKELEAADAVVVISPEWHGMATP
jgi:NAD(P)H-dependent FMN reductase